MSDANDFFSTTEVNARLDLVRHLIENSELVPLVRGPSGIGKTLMASRLQQLAPENWSVCHFEADPTMQPERLLAVIARCVGLPDIAGELLQRLVDRFEVLRKRGRIPVLLVDDAQMLPPTSLITLLRLFERQLNGVRLVSIVLFADEQIDLLLSTPQLQVMSPQAIQAIDLPAMTRQEATAYMKFLLHNEGLSEKLALDEVRMNRLYREVRGIPGPLASAILNAVGEQRVEQNTDSFLSGYKKQLLIGGVPLLMVVLLFMWMISSLLEPEFAMMPEKQVRIEPLPAPGVFDQAEAPLPERIQGEISQSTDSVKVGDPKPQGETRILDDPVSDQAIDLPRVETAPLVTPEIAPVIPVSPGIEESLSNQNQDEINEEDLVDEIEPATDAAPATVQQPKPDQRAITVEIERPPGDEIALVVDEEAKKVEETQVAEETDTTVESPESDEASEDSTESLARVEPEKTLTEQGGDSVASWVMSRSPGHYTLQLIAVENLDSLQRYISNNGLGGEARTFRMMRKGKPWYALLWGDFPDRASAQKAATGLPAKVQKAGVWARTFASLQQSRRQ
jgi:septal ring-binding cell division protein DamX/type II secretory pathway predicted ATPase ExeA